MAYAKHRFRKLNCKFSFVGSGFVLGILRATVWGDLLLRRLTAKANDTSDCSRAARNRVAVEHEVEGTHENQVLGRVACGCGLRIGFYTLRARGVCSGSLR